MSGAPIAWLGRPVLFAGLEQDERLDYRSHLVVHGGMPAMPADELADLAENVNLRGRGGAGFPFATKLRAVVKSAARRKGRPVVVVNGTEGEPSCLKDAALLLRTPTWCWTARCWRPPPWTPSRWSSASPGSTPSSPCAGR